MEESAAVAIQTIRAVLAGTAQFGGDPSAVAARAGLDMNLLADADARVPMSISRAVFEHAIRETGDADLGLHLAELAEFVPHDAIHYAGRACKSLRDVYRMITRYYRIIHAMATLELIEENDTARIIYSMRSATETSPRFGAECTLAILYLRPRAAVGENLRLREVRFRHPRPEKITEHERIFRAPVLFDQPQNELIFDRRMLEFENTIADPRLYAILEKHVEELLAKLPSNDDVLERVRRCLAESLSSEQLRIEDVAARLHLSPRSLQRKLSEAGTSFSELAREMRRNLAAIYLRDRRMPIGEAAFLLGFSDVSTFHRAFKGWFGQTPHEFRSLRAGK
jgi:AraC-like DNA-binding protein